MHRLVILGSLGEFVQLIRLSKSRGWYTIVCDGYPGSAGKALADRAYDIDVGDTDAIAQMCIREQADGIITSFSDYLFECMVKIAEKAGLKCYFDTEHLPYYRDKVRMKDMLTQLGIRTPKYRRLAKDFADDELRGFTFPVVVKPIDKYGSRGVEVLGSVAEIRERFDHTCATSEIKQILVEEYHDGLEFNMMTWVLHGKVHVISIADREKTPVGRRQIPISSRNVYPSRRIDDVIDEATEVLQRVAGFTGQTEGPLSMQFFWAPSTGVSVCEVAGRFFGYEHELTDYAGGLNIEHLLLDYVYCEDAVERTFADYSPRFPRCAAVLYFHGRPGMHVVHQETARALAKQPGVAETWLFYHTGEEIILHGPNPYVARYYIVGDTREEVDALTRDFFSRMSITDADGQEILYRNQIETRYTQGAAGGHTHI